MKQPNFPLFWALAALCAAPVVARPARAVNISAPASAYAPAQQGDPSSFWKQAKEYYDAGRYAEAAEAYRQYIRLRPDAPDARYWLGSSYYQLKQYADAAAAYREAVRLKPDYREAYVFLANSLDYLDRYDDAVAA